VTLRELLQASPRGKANLRLMAATMQMLWEVGRLAKVDQLLPAIRRLPDRMEQHLARVRLLAARAKLQDLRRRQAERFPVPQASVRRCLRCPGPCAFSRETPVVRKCNRAARCDVRPIFARCRPPRNRRGLAGCDNKCNRSQRKDVLPA